MKFNFVSEMLLLQVHVSFVNHISTTVTCLYPLQHVMTQGDTNVYCKVKYLLRKLNISDYV